LGNGLSPVSVVILMMGCVSSLMVLVVQLLTSIY